MNKPLLLLLLVCWGMSKIYAVEIKGHVVDQNSKDVIGFATISLLKSDSSYVAGSQTSTNGHFKLAGNFTKDNYILKTTYLGYHPSYINIKNLNNDIDLGDISIIEESKLLNEVTITGQRVQNKIDRQIVLPDVMQVKSSSNAYDLLNQLSLARLQVNTVERTVNVGQESVQLRINGMKATQNDILAILPKNIKRVEYYDNPGVRFGNEDIGAVIDFIVVRDNSYGGYLALDLQNAPFVEFGNDYGVIKLNHKASEFSFSYYSSYRGYTDRWTDGTESFNFANNPITREIKGDQSPMFYVDHGLNLTYNLTQVDNYVLNISFRDNFFNGDYVYATHNTYKGINKKSYQRSDNDPYSNTPVLDIFLKKHLKNKQTFAFNIVGTHIHTEEFRRFIETDLDDNSILGQFNNEVRGNKYSFITEMAYDKEFDKIKFSAGIKHTQGYANNKYTGSNPFNSDMRNADSYLYSQINGKLTDKLSYSLGLGLTRLWFKENNNDIEYYLFRPAVNLAYALNKDLNISYNFTVDSRTPSLASLSNVEQQSNSFVINRGNPDLKPYKVYRNRFNLNYNKGKVSSSFGAYYNYFRKLFVSTYSIEDDKIISFSDNHKSHHGFSLYSNANIKLIKDIWTVRGWIQADRSIFYGNNVTHTYSALYGGMSTNVMYHNFILSGAFNTRARSLWGEYVNYNQYWQNIELGYKHKEAKMTLGVSFPFESAWSGGGRNISAIAPSNTMTYIKENGRMIYAGFSWNMSFGRKHKAEQKSMNNADYDKGIL